jgi:hypothetical protein
MKSKTNLRKTSPIAAMALLTAAAGVAPHAEAEEQFFSLRAEPTSGIQPTITKGSNNLESLMREVIASESVFRPLSGGNFSSKLSWGGVPGFLRYTQTKTTTTEPTQFTGVLTSDLINIPSKRGTFTASSENELGNKVVDFFKKDGGALYTELMKAVSATSITSPTDGNPNAETARNAATTFGSDAMVTGETNAEKKSGSGPATSNDFQIDANLGTFKAGGITGRTYSLPLSKRFSLSERVGLNIGIPISYTQIGKADVYSGGINIGVPVTIIEKSNAQPVTWRVTPFGGASVTASRDILIGGAILRGGVNNLLAYDFGKFEVAMGNHISQHSSVALDVAGTKIDPGVDQQIMKHGIQVCVPVGENWVLEGYAIRTDFLAAAGVKQFYTYGGDIGYRVRDTRNTVDKIVGTLRLGAYVDTGSGFTGTQIRFGSSWKF